MRPETTMRGWATAVSLIVSSSELVPCVARSMPATVESQWTRSAAPGRSSHGARNPGVCEPCPGQVMASTSPDSPPKGVPGEVDAARESPDDFGGILQDRSEGQGDPHGEGLVRVGEVVADDVRDPAEPVPDGVDVDDERPCGRLEAGGVEVGACGLEQARVLLEGPGDGVDEGRAGQGVPGDRALGEEVVGRHGSGATRPAGCRDVTGDRRVGRDGTLGEVLDEGAVDEVAVGEAVGERVRPLAGVRDVTDHGDEPGALDPRAGGEV